MDKDKPVQLSQSKQDRERRDLNNKVQFSEMSLVDLDDVLSIEIKDDYESKLITCLCFISTYTRESQLNVTLNAPSSSGKTHITTSIASLFPDEDKIELARASPTALFYKEGELDKESGFRIVDLERKILIFTEVPGPHMQMTLRSILSHDKWESKSLVTNKDKKGANRAEEVVLRGYPSTVFCSAKLTFDEQETTRAILLSPEETTQKNKASLHYTAQRSSGNASFNKLNADNPARLNFKERILAIRAERVDNVFIPDIDKVESRFIEMVGVLRGRHNRDLDHLCKLIKAITLLNLWYRRRSDGSIAANAFDIDQAFSLWKLVAESQNQDVPPAVMRFYKDCLLPAWYEKKSNPDYSEAMENDWIGINRQEICLYHLRTKGYKLRDDYLRKELLTQLEASSMIIQIKPSDGDRRSMHVIPRWFPKEENNVGEPIRKDEDDEALRLFED